MLCWGFAVQLVLGSVSDPSSQENTTLTLKEGLVEGCPAPKLVLSDANSSFLLAVCYPTVDLWCSCNTQTWKKTISHHELCSLSNILSEFSPRVIHSSYFSFHEVFEIIGPTVQSGAFWIADLAKR